MMINPDLKREFRLLGYAMGAAYLISMLIVGGILLWIDYGGQYRLARSYAQASRPSVILRDLRQTIGILQPSSDDGFDAVALKDPRGAEIFGLPNGTAVASAANSLLVMRISIPLLVEPGNPRSAQSATLEFYYSLQNLFLALIGSAFVVCILFALYFRKARNSLLGRHEAFIRAKQAEAIQDMARQVSHDIRSPLTALNMAVSATNSLTDDRRAIVIGATKRINEIANALLERSKEGGSFESQNNRCEDLVNLVESIVKEKRIEYAPLKSLAIKTDTPSSLNAKVAVNPTELQRAISNLINNSVEAIDGPGQITLSLRVFSKDVSFTVQDTGHGIPEEILSRLGEKNVSFRKGKAEAANGSGLGLYHAKQMAEQAGGRLTVQSRVGLGTMVSIHLPIISA